MSRPGEVLDLGVQLGLVEKAGSHFTYRGERLGQGRERAAEALRERPELLEQLAVQLVTAAKPPPGAAAPALEAVA